MTLEPNYIRAVPRQDGYFDIVSIGWEIARRRDGFVLARSADTFADEETAMAHARAVLQATMTPFETHSM